MSSALGCNKVVLKSYFGKYVCAEPDGAANANRINPDLRETFAVEDLGLNRIALKAYNGKYLVAEDENEGFNINSNRDIRRSWEIFTVEKVESGAVALKTAHRRYVVAEPDGTLRGDRKAAGKWEKFTAECIQGAFLLKNKYRCKVII